MSKPDLIVRPSVPAEFDAVLPVCVEAFADEAVSAWVEPDPERRQGRTRELFETSLREAVDAGQLVVAFTLDGEPIAASVWIDLDGAPPAPEPDESAGSARTGRAGEPTGSTGPAGSHRPARSGRSSEPAEPADADRRAAHRLAAVLSATSARHPDVPHIYLSAMAALPRRRGLGAGTALLRHGLDRAGELDLPVYLEASTPRNRRLYARHGFEDHGDPIHLPDGGPILQPMWHGGRTANGGAPA